MEIENHYANFFDDMTHPFKNVANVQITGWFNSLGSSTLPFGKLFPAMKRLNLKSVGVQNSRSVVHKFPHLEHLHLEIVDNRFSSGFTEHDVERVLHMNPQIRSLSLDGCSRGLLRIPKSLDKHGIQQSC